MKILMTTDTVGGVWTYSLNLARALRDFNVEVILAAQGLPTEDQWEAARRIDNLMLLAADYKLEWMDEPWQDVEASGEWLLDIAALEQPDVVHLNDYSHGNLPWKTPVLIVGHSCVLSWFDQVRNQPAGDEWDRYRQQVRQGLLGADYVVTPTRQMGQYLVDFYGPLQRQSTIYNGMDGPTNAADQRSPFIFAAGRAWDEAKNITALDEAAADVPWPIRVAGIPHPQGPQTRFQHLHWLGRLSVEEMSRIYAQASIYALPALYEPFGQTALEAAMAGCPLVLGDIPSRRCGKFGVTLPYTCHHEIPLPLQ